MVTHHGRHARRSGSGEPHGRGQFFGTTTIGERGQIVIPKEARDLFELKAGDKLLVLGDRERGGLALVKADLMERFIARFLGGGSAGDEQDTGEPQEDAGEPDGEAGDANGEAGEANGDAGEKQEGE
jgi:AbrB family looped-hinge helix DNA binding protein